MQEELLKKELAATIRLYNSKGWSPATSTNYSFKTEQGQIWVSRSGVDKSHFSENDFIDKPTISSKLQKKITTVVSQVSNKTFCCTEVSFE
jgi:methylthioribulose-1-phosphate dehydratase